MQRRDRLREEALFWAAVVLNVVLVVAAAAGRTAAHAARRAARWARHWWTTNRPAVEAGVADAGAAAGVALRQDLPALWRRTRPVAARAATALRVRAGPVAAGVVLLGAAAWLLPPVTLDLAATAVDADLPPLHQRTEVLAADGTPLGRLHRGADRRSVALEDVSPMLARLVVASEDRRFWDHDGYDFGSLVRAAAANVRAGAVVEGGSTITQQLAKQNFTGDDRSLVRKAEELVHAVALERRFSKRELLERYLNQVYFGSGAYGVAAAAEEYFGVGPGDLDAGQAALLAGLVRAPDALDPRADPVRAEAVRDAVLEAGVAAGAIDAGVAARHRRAPLELAPARTDHRSATLDAVVRAFLADRRFGHDREERARRLFTGGLTIRTTFDPGLQAAARSVVAAERQRAPAAALAAVDPWTGAVRALASAGPPAVASLDLATQARRQPGSALKPFVALAALEAGLGADERLAGDAPVAFRYGEQWWAVDNHGGEDHGPVTLADALARSVNTAFAQLGVAVGPDAVAGVLAGAGVDVDAALGPHSRRGPSIALGGVHRGVSPLELAGAYGLFATNGLVTRPFVIAEVRGPDGDVVHRHRPEATRAADPAAAAEVRRMLEEAVAEGTGRGARLSGAPVAGKTGTTQQAADAWFAGVVPRLAAAVWVGDPAGSVAIPGATGGRLAAPVWAAFMEAALGGRPAGAFPPAPAPGAPPEDDLRLPRPVPCDDTHDCPG